MKIKKSSILIIVSLIPVLISEGMLYILGISSQSIAWIRMIETCIYFFMFAYYFLKRKTNWCINILVLIYLTIFLSAAVHHVFNNAMLNYIGGFLMCLIFDYWLRKKYDAFLRILTWILMALILLNFITVIMFPQGMYETALYKANWILGYKNSHFGYVMAAMASVTIQAYRKKRRLTFFDNAFLILSCVGLYLVDSVMAFVACSLYTIMAILLINFSDLKLVRRILDFLSVRRILAVTLVIWFVMVFFQSSSFFKENIVHLMNAIGRDSSISGRIPIWTAAIKYIKHSPIIGYGIIDSNEFVRASGILGGTHAHNYILNILIMGGIVCLAEHIYLYFKTIKHILKHKGFISYVLTFIIGLYFFTGITNVNFYTILFNPIFVLTYYAVGTTNISGTKERRKNVVK